MNNRIDQLARAAGFKHPDHVGLSEEYAYFDHVRFAELIVKECAEVAEDYDGAHYVGTTIKQHFGVSE